MGRSACVNQDQICSSTWLYKTSQQLHEWWTIKLRAYPLASRPMRSRALWSTARHSGSTWGISSIILPFSHYPLWMFCVLRCIGLFQKVLGIDGSLVLALTPPNIMSPWVLHFPDNCILFIITTPPDTPTHGQKWLPSTTPTFSGTGLKCVDRMFAPEEHLMNFKYM